MTARRVQLDGADRLPLMGALRAALATVNPAVASLEAVRALEARVLRELAPDDALAISAANELKPHRPPFDVQLHHPGGRVVEVSLVTY